MQSATTGVPTRGYNYYPSNNYSLDASSNLLGLLVVTVCAITTYLKNKKDEFLSHKYTSINERSVVGYALDDAKQISRLSRFDGDRNTITNLISEAPTTQADKEKETIKKQTQAFDIFNRIFDVAVYSIIPAVLICTIAFMATASAGVGMTVLGPFLGVIGGVFLALVITQASSFGLLCHSHKNIDKDIKKEIDREIGKISQTVQNMNENNSNLENECENHCEENKTLSVLNKANVMNLVISIRDLNLSKIHENMDEYNDLILSGISNQHQALELAESGLVNDFIIMLGSLFVNGSNERSCLTYKGFVGTVKDDVLTLLNNYDVDILSPLVRALSRRDASDQSGNKTYNMLKKAIIAKLEGVGGSNSTDRQSLSLQQLTSLTLNLNFQ
jgi:hypothetical protein